MKIKIPAKFELSSPLVIVAVVLLLATSFYSGYAWNKLRHSTDATTDTATATFTAQKSQKPELKFFVMSFCPYGNQMEDVLRPVFDLLKDKADLTPHYIFDKIDNLDTYCKSRSGDVTQCSAYIKNGYFQTLSECQKAITAASKSCLDTNNYIKSGNGAMYASLHGRQEANQDVREICAWNLTSDKSQWWNFVAAVNKNCTSQNADSCWEDQAKSAGFDAAKISECFNRDAISLIEKEYALSNKYNVSGSPTVLINDVAFPPETAYTQDGKGTLKIGDKIATQDKFRTPNVVKAAICASFQKAPNECKTVLNELTGTAPAAGGCN